MSLQQKKCWKKMLAAALMLVLAVGSLMEYVPQMSVVHASDTEPVYSAATGEMKYSQAKMSVPAQGSHDFTVAVPEDETYYMGFTVKTTGDFYFDYRGSGRLYIGPKQYCVLGVNGKEDWVQKAVGAENGVRVTLKSTPDTVTIWLNGEKAIEDAALNTKGQGMPKVSWAAAETELTDVQIWTAPEEEEPSEELSDEPVYSEKAGMLYEMTGVSSPDGAYAYTYDPETGVVAIPAGATKTEFKSELPTDVEEYYYTMVIQGSTVVSLSSRGYKGSEWFIQIQPSGYTVKSIDGTQTSWQAKPEFSKMRNEGLRVTVHSTKNSVKAWFDGELLIDYDSEHTGEARPRIVSCSAATTVSNIRIWTPKEEEMSDEPVYSEKTGMLYEMTGVSSPDGAYAYTYDAETGVVAVPAGATKTEFKSGLLTDVEEYYYTMVIQGSTVVSLSSRGYKGSEWFIQIQPSGYTVKSIDGTQTSWQAKPEFSKMRNEGLRVTVHSTKNSVKAWFDGELLIDYDSEHTGEARPRIVSCSAATTVSNIRIWTPKEEVSDEPVYNEETDQILYTAETISIPAGGTHNLAVTVPEDETYYVSYTVKTTGDFYFNYRGSGRLYIGPTQYCALGVNGKEDWVQKAVGVENGVRVTLKSTSDAVTIWLNGEKAIEDAALDTKGQGAPKVSWTAAAAELTNIQIWTAQEEEQPEEPSDEPVYNPETDTLYNMTGVSSPDAAYDYTYDAENGVVTVPKGATKTDFNSGLLADAEEYYYTMVIKGSAAVNLASRGYKTVDWFVQIQPSGYTVKSADGAHTGWQTKDSFGKMRDEGLRVTVYSTKNSVKAWFDGELLIDFDSEYEGNAQPRIVSTSADITVSNIKIWTPKSEEPPVPTETDEPVYDETTDCKYEINHVTGGTYVDGVITIPEDKNGIQSIFLSDLPYNSDYYVTMTVKTAGAINFLYRDGISSKQGVFHMQSSGYESLAAGTGWVNKNLSALTSGARITWHSAPDRFEIWVNGEKLTDEAFNREANAQPGIAWSFGKEVKVTDICLWTKEDAMSDEPVYDPKSQELYPVTGYGNGSWENGQLEVALLTNSYFATGLSAKSDYYMSLVIESGKSVNVMYRNPGGLFNLNMDGYESIGTEGGWVSKPIRKLPYGVRVTVHSTPDWITIWVDGEKIIDERYEKTGESSPGIAWSFEKGVKVRDIQVWADLEGPGAYLGDVEETANSKLSEKKSYGVGIPGTETAGKYLDQQPIGKSVVNAHNEKVNSSYEVFPSNVSATEKQSVSLMMILILTGIAVALIGAVVLLVVWIRKQKRETAKQ